MMGVGQSSDAGFGGDIVIRGDTMIVAAAEHQQNGHV
jgi:hypothetical protein